MEELARIVHEKDINALKGLKEEISEFSKIFVDLTGLSLNEVERNRSNYGRNELPHVQPKRFIQFVWEASQDKILILLAVSAVVSLVVHFRSGGWIEGVAILTAVVIVILVNSVNDWKKELLFRSLLQVSQDGIRVKVKRSNVFDLIPVRDLVLFDLIQLEPGNILPADALLVEETHTLVVDESSATGESKTLTKSLEADPFFLSGTRITDGSGIAVVVAVGEASFHGKLRMALRGDVERTPLQNQLNDLADSIAKFGLTLAVLLFIALIGKNFTGNSYEKLANMIPGFLIAAITIVVVAVPEGLPMAVTLALAFATNRMLKDNNLVRVLSSCETMGRVTSICSDKTGTLTENRMTVVRSSISDSNNDDEKFIQIITEGLAVNSNAFEIENESGQFEFVGSATEAALLRFIKERFNAAYSLIRLKVPISRAIPFSSTRKLMISVTGGDASRVHLKGAAEIVLEKCKTLMKPSGEICEMTEDDLRDIKRLLNEMNSEALRSIGQAFTEVNLIDNLNESDESLIDAEYCWLGVYGIEDPLRSGVNEAVSTCQKAGIFVRMVTGDCRETAESIARRCGILMRGGLVMEGQEFRRLSDEQLIGKLARLQVLARSSPMDKKRLVKLLKSGLGEIVAVTGDGSNDGPALKASDVGFSMGITGTQLAQEASSIVLLDDNFASIVKAASWGRSITRSVRKFLQFQLTVNVSAVGTAVLTALTSQSSVLTAIQMLWVNLLMDSLGALALATDLPTPDLLQVPPEKPGSPLIDIRMKWNIAIQSCLQLTLCLGIFYMGTFKDESDWRRDFVQMFDLKNSMFWIIWIGTLIFQVLIVQFGGKVFETVTLSVKLWFLSAGLAFLSIPLALIVKAVFFIILPKEQYERLHPTREQLAWQSAINNIRTSARFYSAIRRKTGKTGNSEVELFDDDSESKSNSDHHFNFNNQQENPFNSPEISPKSTDSLLI